jgi:hypothetical protein
VRSRNTSHALFIRLLFLSLSWKTMGMHSLILIRWTQCMRS